MNISLLDHNKSAENLINEINNNHLVHAYIFISDDDEVRQALFLKMALSIFNKDNICNVYSQLISHNHVDINYYDTKNKVNVDVIEDLIEDTHILPVVSDHKLYYIDNAENLNIQCQNKLLKTFEEPPSFVTIVLGVNNETNLLTTIKSRGKKVYINYLDTKDIYNELINSGIENDIAKLASSFSQGNYKKAIDFASNTKYNEIYQQALNTFANLNNSKQIVDYLYTDIFKKENIYLTLDFFELFLSDILKVCSNSDLPKSTLINDNTLKKLAKGFNITSTYMAIDAINNGRAKLNSNISSISVAEKILFDILEAKYIWQQ